MRNALSGVHPFSKLIFATFIALVSFLLILLIGIFIAVPIFQIDIQNISTLLSDYNNPVSIKFLKYLQTLQPIALFIIPAFIASYFFHHNSLEYLKLNRKTTLVSVILILFILIFSLPVINYAGMLNKNMDLPDWLGGIERWMREKEDVAQAATEAFLTMDTPYQLVYNIFMIAILPAIGEELMFRGILQKLFSEWTKNIHIAIGIAAFLFSAMHFQFYGFLPRFLLGLLLGYLFYWSGSIWASVFGHFANNAFAVFIYYFSSSGFNEGIDNVGVGENGFLYIIPSMLVVFFLLYTFYKQQKR